MDVALKEWASVVEALGQGKQIFLLRKGGIVEARRGFELRHPEFLLFPTFEHQHAGFLQPAWQELVSEPAGDVVPVRYLARIAEVLRAPASPDRFLAMPGQHIWAENFFRQRYAYRPDLPLYVVLVRTYRLAEEQSIPNRPSYAGCKSWVNLTENLATEGAAPVLDDERFGHAAEQLRAALEER